MNTLQHGQPIILQPGMISLVQGTATLPAPRAVPIQTLQGGTLQQGVSVQAPGVAATLPAQPKRSAKHIPLARCRSLYLGSAVPLETSQGLEAVQGPCRERYPFESKSLSTISFIFVCTRNVPVFLRQ